MDSLERNRKISSFVVHLTLVLISITMLVPFFWMVLTAFKSTTAVSYTHLAYGKLSVMLPMISSLEEVRESKALFHKCRTELEKQGVPMAERIPLGVMIETPAAVDVYKRQAENNQGSHFYR